MAIKTFTTGEVLTASDTNTYLANSGLVYVTSATVGTAVSSVTISGCFTSTYDNYRVIYQAGSASSTAELLLKFNNSTGSTYSHGGVYVQYGSNTVFGEQASGVSTGIRVGNTNTATFSCSFDIISAYPATQTQVVSNHADTTFWSSRGGRDSNAASQTGLILLPSGGTLTGGKVVVYGYRGV
jgi:hypothetical protein